MPVAPREDRIRRALAHLRHHTTDEVDQQVAFGPEQYRDPEIARRERDLVFGRVPSIVAHSSELPEPNDFITLQMPRNKVIVVRQKDGSVKTFVNLCRHRGALLEEQEKGRRRLFSCGYHRRSYDTDGSPRAVARDNTFGEIARWHCGLRGLPTEERHGFVWAVDDAAPERAAAAWLGPDMGGVGAGKGMDKRDSAQEEGFAEPVNWKIMQD